MAARPRMTNQNLKEGFMEWLRRIIEDPRSERFIMGLIVFNAVTLGLETNQFVMAHWGSVLHVVDQIILAVFVIELAGRIVLQRAAFFRDGWNIFDFIVIGISLAPATDAFTVLRALRVLRLLRLVTVVPSLRRVVGGLIGALPGMGSILLLIGLVYYVCAVMAVNLFGEDFPNLFGTLAASLFTLFTIMTLEGWVDGVVRPVMEKYPYAWLFFIPFIIGTTFTILNLFIGIIVNAIQDERSKAEAEEREAERQLVHAETEPVANELKSLRAEIVALRADIAARLASPR
jgi:voltage-gated sodium channel